MTLPRQWSTLIKPFHTSADWPASNTARVCSARCVDGCQSACRGGFWVPRHYSAPLVRAPRIPARVVLGRFAVALAVTLPMVLAGIVGVNVLIDQKIASIPRLKLKTAQDTNPGGPANFLLIGSDSRAFVQTPEEAQAFGSQATNGGQHSDTLMVIHVDPAQQTGYLVSFPRDLEVDIPGVGKQKINAAYDVGPQKVIDTLAQDFNVPIQHYFEVDFQSFQGIVDAMGGVQIYIPAPARDAESGFEFIPFNFHPGCFLLDGAQALAYARSRTMEEYIDGRWQLTGQDAPDLHRIERQQSFLRRLGAQAFKQSVNDPLAANHIVDKTFPKLKADNSLSRDDINKLIRSFRKVDPNDPNTLQTVTLPTVVGPTTQSLGSVLNLKQPDADLVLARLRDFNSGPPKQQGPKPAQIRVRVFNGSARSGAASTTSADLQKQGFVSAGVGNHPKLTATEVHYRQGSQDKAKVVASYLGGVGKVVEDKSVVDADVNIVLGTNFKAVAAPPNATAPAASTPSTAPASAPASTGAAPSTTPAKGGAQAPPADPTQC
jgi:LCP family protein required for cell wall assembly